MRAKTPSFIAEFPLRTTAGDERELGVRMEAARHIYNASLGESLRRADLMRQSKSWQAARQLPKKSRAEAFRAVVTEFDFNSASIQKFAETCRDACWIGEHLGSHDVQTTSLRAFRAVEAHVYKKWGRPRFKGYKRLHSVEGKGDAVIRFRIVEGVPKVLWSGLSIPLMLDPRDRDRWQAQALENRTKYVRVLRRNVRGTERWYAQLIQEGEVPRKERHPVGHGTVGLDLGPSTIAVVAPTLALLVTFCAGVKDPASEIRRIQRGMDRSRRATNPDAYDSNGSYIQGKKIKVRSGHYRRLVDRKADTERRLSAERKRAHGELANLILAQGDEIKLEAVSYKAFQRNFGRSVGRRAPSMFVAILKRKAESAGASVIEFATRTTKLSQYDHVTGTCKKKPLSQRYHGFPDGSRVQRDLYSAWLARYVQGDKLDASRLCNDWAAAEPLLRQAASSTNQSTSGCGLPSPTPDAGVRVDRVSKRIGCSGKGAEV